MLAVCCARRVVQRSSTLLALEGPWMSLTRIVIGYHLQKNQSSYDDLGGNYFDRIHSDGLKRYLVKRLEQLGHKVTLEPIEAA